MNRTLVYVERPAINGKKIDRRIYFDRHHTRQCFGPHSVITTEEYRQKHGEPVVIDQIRLMLPIKSGHLLELPGNVSAESASAAGKGDPLLIDSIRSFSNENDVQVTSGLQVEEATIHKKGQRVSREDLLQEYGNMTSRVLFIGEGNRLRTSMEAKGLGF